MLKPLAEVMLSSTFEDLKQHRSQINDALQRQRLHPIMMETDASLSDQDMIDASLEKVNTAAAYICIVGKRYGQIRSDAHRNPSNLSLTELEFDQAVLRGIPIAVLMMAPEYPIPDSANEFDRNLREKLELFRKKVRHPHRVVAVFSSWQDFLIKASTAVSDVRQAIEKRLPTQHFTSEFPTNEITTPKANVRQVIQYLLRQLDLIDADFEFDHRWFTPLQSQVRVSSKLKNATDNVTDLMSALSAGHGQLSLVLGLPGIGKSVAMREFARRTLKNAEESGKLAIYIPLRDWLPDAPWTIASPPRMSDLELFLSNSLKFDANPEVSNYLADFRQLHANGDIIWIFDSFDEMPGILDIGDGPNKGLITEISRLLDDFLRRSGAGVKPQAGGIIASRFERKPDLPATFMTTFELQPFSDDLIRDAFARIDDFPSSLSDELFRPPGELVPLARTPFYHGLIAAYGIAMGCLPKTTAELFESYVVGKLRDQFISDDSLSISSILIIAEEISYFLFNSNRFGLGAPLAALEEAFPGKDIEKAILSLEKGRLMRRGVPPVQLVSFSHRRLHEYFVVRYKARAGLGFDLRWITDDTRERDSAVLQVELSEPDVAERIALSLWDEIRKGEGLNYADKQFYQSLNCLRFLVEAFRTRTEAINKFRDDLESMITRRLEKSDDLISIKIAVETIGLLSPQGLERNIVAALRHGDFWIRETAIDACRFLTSLPPNVVGHLWRCIAFLSEDTFIKELQRLRFSFRLSPALVEVFGLIELRATDIQRWQRWKWIPAMAARLPVVPFLLSWLWVERLLPTKGKIKETQEKFAQLYISDRNVFSTLNLNYESSPVQPGSVRWRLVHNSFVTKIPWLSDIYRDVSDGPLELSRWLSDVNRDRSYGLARYRASLARNTFISWYFSAILWIVMFGSLVVGLGIYGIIDSLEDVAMALILALLFGFVLFCALVPLMAPLFARRTYPLIVPGENVTSEPHKAWIVHIIGTILFFGVVGLFGVVTTYLQRFRPINIAFSVWLVAAVLYVLVYQLIWPRVIYRRQRARDQKTLSIARALGSRSRIRIAETFASFESSDGRELYVDWLGEQGFIPSEEWPSGRPPNLGDLASTKLAKLEHRWRGFDK